MEPLLDLSLLTIVILSGVAFAAGFIDAIAGGGGMLTLPALLLAGISPVTSLAINKMTGIAGTTFAVLKYTLEHAIHWRTVRVAIIPCLIASYFGGLVALNLPASLLRWGIILCIPVALVIVLSDRSNNENTRPPTGKKLTTIGSLAPIGFYDGLLGPGTGTYMAITAKKLLNMPYLEATATIKPLNLATNIGAAIAFLIAGKVIWMVAIPMMLCNSLGGWLGSHVAVRGGSKLIRNSLIIVLSVMLIINIIKIIK